MQDFNNFNNILQATIFNVVINLKNVTIFAYT